MARHFDKGTMIALVLVLVLLVLCGTVMVYEIHELHDAQKMVVHTHQVTENLDDILVLLVDAETGQRGYIITGNETYLEPYDAARKQIFERVDDFADLTIDNAAQQAKVLELRQLVETRLAVLEKNVALRRTEGFDTVSKQVGMGVGKQAMDKLRTLIRSMIDEENRLMAERTDTSQNSYHSAIFNGIVTTIAGIAMVGAFAWIVNRNLGARARAADALHQEREQLRITLASIGDGVIATDIAGNVTFLNPIAEQLTGWTQAEAAYQPLEKIFEIVNETTRVKVQNPALRALAEGVIVGLANHTILISKQGSECAIADSAAPIRGLQNQALGSVLVFRDVSEDRAAERALRESEARKAAVLETALDAVISCDGEGRVVEFNPAAEQMFGYSRDEALHKDLGGLIVPPGMRERHRASMARYMQTGISKILNQRLELSALRSDGTEFPVELAITRISGEGPAFFTAYLRDISERKAAQAKLDQRMRLLALNAQVSEALITAQDLSTMLRGAAEALLRQLDGAFVRIWTVDEQNQSLVMQASAGVSQHLDLVKARIPIEKSRIGEIAEQRKPHVTNSIRDDEHVPEQAWAMAEGLTSFAGFPLLAGGRIVGVMAMFARHDLEDHTLQTMGTVADDIALGIDRQRAIREMNESRKLLQVTLRSIGDAVLTTDSQGNVTFLNDVAQELTGWTQEEAFGLTTDQVFHIVNESTGELVESPVAKVLRDGVIVGLANHTVLISKNGERHPIDDSGAPIWLDEKIAGVVLVFRDVRERRAAEENLKQSEDRFRQIADTMPQFVWVTRGDGYPDYFNRRWHDYMGLGEEDTLGDGWVKRLHPDDLRRSIERWNHSVQTGEDYEIEYRFRSKSGEYRWFLGRGVPVRDHSGRILKWLGTCTDIEDFKQAEEDRQKFVSLVENSTDFIGISDLNLMPIYINRAGLRLIGLDSIEQARQTPVQEFFFPEDQGMILNEFFPAVMRRGQGEIEVRFRHFKTGHSRWMLYNVFSLIDQKGMQVGLATVSRNISERKLLEDNLRQVAADLSEANRRKNEFLATLAHELRNPLAPIRTGLELMKLAVDDPVTLEQTRGMMERQTQQMVRLIDDLLDVSRITQGKLQLRRARVELVDVIRSAVEATRPFIDEAGHELVVILPPQAIAIDADLNRLAQVVSNLLSNATKYTPDGGRIELIVEQEQSNVIIRVKDTGLGIPPEMVDQIFEMFTQIDRPLEKGYTGLGIGLTLVKRLIEMHCGSIAVESAGLNQGSEFRVTLPIVVQSEQPHAAAHDDGQSLPREKHSHRILIVDDNKIAAEMLGRVLTMMGHEIQLAHDGLEALAAAKKMQPELVLMDLGMPKLSGYEAAKRIRSELWGREMVLVALTGWGQEEDKQRTKDAGFDHHLTKPTEPAMLQDLLANLHTYKSKYLLQ
jgi:PAS domain S-box-containing protein